jgi:hypothetical protein
VSVGCQERGLAKSYWSGRLTLKAKARYMSRKPRTIVWVGSGHCAFCTLASQVRIVEEAKDPEEALTEPRALAEWRCTRPFILA